MHRVGVFKVMAKVSWHGDEGQDIADWRAEPVSYLQQARAAVHAWQALVQLVPYGNAFHARA